VRTVEGELATAVERITGESVALTVAGRTDAGVHARGQVVSLGLSAAPPSRLARRLNAVLPDEIVVAVAESAPDGFDARRDARARLYRYRVLASEVPSPFERGRALFWPHRLDREALDACAAALSGSHAFTAFTPTETSHVRFERDVSVAEWAREEGGPPGMLAFAIEADTFMRHMVRVLVGTMLEVGAGRREVEDFEHLLDGAPRSAAGPTAPAHGLYLEAVRY
jgi:tRNA pseudouridine38-40 synthase